MAFLGVYEKQTREELPIDISYERVIGSRAYTSITFVVETPPGITMLSATLSDKVLQIYVGGGADATLYKWTVITTIVIGGRPTIVEDEFGIIVNNV